MKEMKWVTVILGVVLFLAPFVLGYSDDSGALWTSLVLAVVIAILGYVEQYKVVALVGVITFLAPWVIGFDGESGALWSCLLLGGATAVLNGYVGFTYEKDLTTGTLEHRHTAK